MLLAFFLVGILGSSTEAQREAVEVLRAGVMAPPLKTRQGGEWLNTLGPLQLKDLRGKFVILDFWTYCCSNCMHILPELKKLEHKYADSLVVIGVHSGKFATEWSAINVREAMLRYEIEHPVINDPAHVIWSRYKINRWPTIIVIDPRGRVIGRHAGEIGFEAMDRFLAGRVEKARQRKQLDETPLHFNYERDIAVATPLSFPGKVHADEQSKRLFIADSNHNRIVVANFDGMVIDVIGSGTSGREDGAYDSATFNHPQGLALYKESLFVADTENHLIRKVDLINQTVSTVAGTGKQAHWRAKLNGRDLNSPWSLCRVQDDIYIAMAGAHTIWRMNAKGGSAKPYSGNAYEDVVDGPRGPTTFSRLGFASFAQPSGLASDGQQLFVADSEGSSIRGVPLGSGLNQRVTTLLGTSRLSKDRRLFTFGDRDGSFQHAMLQHPLGVAYVDQRLYVADTYNNKIKLMDLSSGTIRTIAGSTKAGNSDSPPQFDEPAGISYAAGKLFVADTNNHSIRVLNFATDTVSTLKLNGLKPPALANHQFVPTIPNAPLVEFNNAHIQIKNQELPLRIELLLPPNFKWATSAPSHYLIKECALVDPQIINQQFLIENPQAEMNFSVPLKQTSGKSPLEISLIYYYCQDDFEALCGINVITWKGMIELSEDGDSSRLQLYYAADEAAKPAK